MKPWLAVLASIALLGSGCIDPLADEDDEQIDPAEDSNASDDDRESEREDDGSEDGPEAAFTADCEGLDCTFDASNSSDPDGEISSYEWDFGETGNETQDGNDTSDGNATGSQTDTSDTNATGEHVTHTYEEAGTYTVELTVSNDDGDNDTASEAVTVTANASGSEDGDAEWQHDNRTGTVSGTNAIVASASETEEFDVVNGTEALRLNLTTDGDDLDVCIRDPTAEGGECTAEEETEDGQLNWTAEAPPGGGWTVELTAQGIGPQSVDYELVVSQLVPPGAAENGTEEDGGGNDTLAVGASSLWHQASTPSWSGALRLLPSLAVGT